MRAILNERALLSFGQHKGGCGNITPLKRKKVQQIKREGSIKGEGGFHKN